METCFDLKSAALDLLYLPLLCIHGLAIKTGLWFPPSLSKQFLPIQINPGF